MAGKKLKQRMCMVCGNEFVTTGNKRICSEQCIKERNRLWHKNRRKGIATKSAYTSCIAMDQALDERGCELVKDFFGKLIRAAEMAREYRLPMNVDVIANLMQMYRAREI